MRSCSSTSGRPSTQPSRTGSSAISATSTGAASTTRTTRSGRRRWQAKAKLEKQGRFKQIHTEVEPAGPFYLAEGYHQDYYKKNPVRYKFYRLNCGRDARLAEVWGKAN